jgi:hypothetical protein
MNTNIKVIFLLSYDYEYLKYSLPCIYKNANKILLSIDKNRLSWTGNKYLFDESIFDWVKEFDVENKIQIYEDVFYIEGYTAMENETRQRQLSADFLGEGGWTIQIDVDEYFIDFSSFVDFLNLHNDYLKAPKLTPISFSVNWLTLYKQDQNGFYYIDKCSDSWVKIATNYPQYRYARLCIQKTIYSNFLMLHQSWARTREELEFKLINWGHNTDVNDPLKYLEIWDSVNPNNYKNYSNFSPFPKLYNWKTLGFVKAKDVNKLISEFKNINYPIPKFKIFIKNLAQKIIYGLRLNTLYYKKNLKK